MTEPTDEAPEAEPPARRRFLLGRLAGAVRRQDWFTVLVEIAIVVLGVVIGFQVTAWGQARSDRAKERTYIVQLESDLRETLRLIGDVDSASAPSVRASAMLLRAYRMSVTPPPDSIQRWLRYSVYLDPVDPVVGAAEALVATGDLGLIRDDSLRRAVPAYLSQTQSAVTEQTSLAEGMRQNVQEMLHHFAIAELIGASDSTAVDSLARADDDYPLPEGPRLEPFPFRAADLLASREAYRTVEINLIWHRNLMRVRREMRESAERLLARVHAARGVALDTTAARL